MLIANPENDREIVLTHTLALKQRFTRTRVEYLVIASVGHNDIAGFPDYREAVRRFIESSG